jgi:hypothetical protein
VGERGIRLLIWALPRRSDGTRPHCEPVCQDLILTVQRSSNNLGLSSPPCLGPDVNEAPTMAALSPESSDPPIGVTLPQKPVPIKATVTVNQRDVVLPWLALMITRTMVRGDADVDGNSDEEFSGLQGLIQTAMLRRSFPWAWWRSRTPHEARTVALLRIPSRRYHSSPSFGGHGGDWGFEVRDAARGGWLGHYARWSALFVARSAARWTKVDHGSRHASAMRGGFVAERQLTTRPDYPVHMWAERESARQVGPPCQRTSAGEEQSLTARPHVSAHESFSWAPRRKGENGPPVRTIGLVTKFVYSFLFLFLIFLFIPNLNSSFCGKLCTQLLSV